MLAHQTKQVLFLLPKIGTQNETLDSDIKEGCKAGPPHPGGQQPLVGLPGGLPREHRGRGRQASISFSLEDPGWQRACQTSRLPFVSF